MRFDYKLYVVTDDFGRKDAVVAGQECDGVQICGMKNPEGKDVYFESEAYHLQHWCGDNGLFYKEYPMWVEV